MDTKAATNNVRLNQWSQIIRDRNQSGLSVDKYCEEHNLSRNAYFYWLRKLKTCVIESNENHFAELSLPLPEVQPNVPALPVAYQPDITVELNGAKIYVSSSATREALSMVVEVLSHA